MELIWTKVLALVLMLIITFTVGILPLKVRKLILKVPQSYKRSQIILSCLLCFGAGILLGTVFLHLLPEVLENVEEAKEKGFISEEMHFPLGELLILAGFFFMYLIEELVHMWVHNNQEDSHDHHHVHHHHNNTQHNHSDMQKVDSLNIHTLSVSDDVVLVAGNGSVCHSERKRCESTPSVAVLVGCDNPVVCTDTLNNCTHNTVTTKMPKDVTSITQPNKEEGSNQKVNAMRSILVILALSIHGSLEGLSLGLEEANSDVWLMFAALSSHKVAICFSIGMELLEKNVIVKYYILYMAIFAMASPIGIIIGGLLFEFADQSIASGLITIMVLQGLSGGTIMFVVFCEVLERERSKTSGRLYKLLALFVGFIIMALLQLVDHHHHDHGGEEQSSTIASVM